MLVQDLLKNTTKVVSLSPKTPVFDAARKMVEHSQGSVLVSEGDTLLGIFTERDLMVRVVAEGKDPATTLLEEVMSSQLYTTTVDRRVTDVRRELRQRHIRHVPVIDKDGQVQAVLSVRDLLQADLIETRTAKQEMEGYIRGEAT